jgi:hypothetical protein
MKRGSPFAALVPAALLAALASGWQCAGGRELDVNAEKHLALNPTQTLASISGTLKVDSKGLKYLDARGAERGIEAVGPVPYRVVALGPPIVVTTIGSDLLPVTYAGAEQFQRYAAYLPEPSAPPVVALSPAGSGPNTDLLLLKPDGGVGYSFPGGEYLSPASNCDPNTAVTAVPSADADLLMPLGKQPEIVAVECDSFTQRWAYRVESEWPSAGADLFALSTGGLLIALQHDFEKYSFLVLSEDGRLLSSIGFEGQPVVSLVWPGPQPITNFARCGAYWAELGVVEQGRDRKVLRFSFRDGTMKKLDVKMDGAPARDERELIVTDVGERVEQGLLPTAIGPHWSLPALCNTRDEVLVVDSSGAAWR